MEFWLGYSNLRNLRAKTAKNTTQTPVSCADGPIKSVQPIITVKLILEMRLFSLANSKWRQKCSINGIRTAKKQTLIVPWDLFLVFPLIACV